MPVLNEHIRLEKSINSVLTQTYYRLQLVLLIEEENRKVIDLCDSISKKDNRVKLIIIKNQTVKRATNLGISYAKGKYIAFLEPGDYLEPRAYEVMLSSMKPTNAKMAICGQIIHHENRKRQVRQVRKERTMDVSTALAFLYSTQKGVRQETQCIWNKVYKRELFKNIRFCADKDYEESYIMGRLIIKCYRITYVSEAYYHHIAKIKEKKYSKKQLKDRIEGKELEKDMLQHRAPKLVKRVEKQIQKYTTLLSKM